MKVYTLERNDDGYKNTIGIYTTLPLAYEDLEFIKKDRLSKNNSYYQYSFTSSTRIRDHNNPDVKAEYMELERYKDDNNKWEQDWHIRCIYTVVERDLEEISLETKVSKIQKWQKSKHAKDMKHCAHGKPTLDYGDHLILKCPTCTHIQTIPDIIYEYEDIKKNKK